MRSSLLPLSIHPAWIDKKIDSAHPVVSRIQNRDYTLVVKENRLRVAQLIDSNSYIENEEKIELLNRVFSVLFSSFSIVYPLKETDLDKEVQFHKASVINVVVNILARSNEDFYFHIDVNNLDMYFHWISKVLDTYPKLSQLISDEDHILFEKVLGNIRDKSRARKSSLMDEVAFSIISKEALEKRLDIDNEQDRKGIASSANNQWTNIWAIIWSQWDIKINPKLKGTIKTEILDFSRKVANKKSSH